LPFSTKVYHIYASSRPHWQAEAKCIQPDCPFAHSFVTLQTSNAACVNYRQLSLTQDMWVNDQSTINLSIFSTLT